MSTVKEMKATLAAANIEFPAKAKKSELEAILAAATAPARKRRVSTKEILRALFSSVGDKLLVEDVVTSVQAEANVKPETIGTMIGDLKNPKYCGPAGPFYIDRVGEEYVRVDAPTS